MPTRHWVCDLPGFGGGMLTATIRSAHSDHRIQIKTAAPGSIHVCDLYAGPKDWSPHGLVPKDWQLLLTLDGGWADYQVAYTNIEGHQARVSMVLSGTLSGKKNSSGLYFVPM